MSQFQIKITLASGERRLIELLVAEGWRRDLADAGLDCFRRGLALVLSDYLQSKSVAEQSKYRRLQSAIVRLSIGSWIEEVELAEIARDAEVPLEALLAIRERLCQPAEADPPAKNRSGC